MGLVTKASMSGRKAEVGYCTNLMVILPALSAKADAILQDVCRGAE